MIIKKVFLKNFKSYGDSNGQPIEIDISNYEKMAVVGNNGAGKSTIIDAVTFALFGKAIATESRDVGMNELINDRAKEAFVKLVFEKDGIDYEVERLIKRNRQSGMARLFINGEASEQVGLRAVNELINRILGMDYDTFVSSTIIRQDEMDRLTSKKPSERKETLVKIFGIDIYEKFAEKAKEKMRETDTQKQVNEARLGEMDKTIKTEPIQKENLKDLKRQEKILNINSNRIKIKSEKIEKKCDEYLNKKT